MCNYIISADDFGLAAGINRGIIEGFKKGIITSASICANGRSFEEAILLVKENPGLDIGLHIVLIEEKPLSDPSLIKSLVNKNGLLFKKNYQFLLRYFLGAIRKEDIEQEIREQFRKAFKSGLKVTHVDSHRHLHILPGILNIIIKLCQEYKVFSVRCSYQPLAVREIFSCSVNIFRTILQLPINITCFISRRKLKNSGIYACRACYGLLHSGSFNFTNFKKTINVLENRAGVYEIMFHPAIVDTELMCKYRHWKYNWAADFLTLTSPDIKRFVKEKNIKLLSFRSAGFP